MPASGVELTDLERQHEVLLKKLMAQLAKRMKEFDDKEADREPPTLAELASGVRVIGYQLRSLDGMRRQRVPAQAVTQEAPPRPIETPLRRLRLVG